MAKEFIITEGDIDSTLDMLLESPVNPYKKEITAITMGKFLARNPLSKRPRKGNPAFAGALPPKQRNRKEFTEEQSRSVCAELTKFKEFVKLRGPNSNIPQEKFSAKEVRKLLQFIDARIDRFGFCDVKEGECTGGAVKNDEGECVCPDGYHWEPAEALSGSEGGVVPTGTEGKCVKDEEKPAKRLESTIKIYDWSPSKGGVTVIGGPKYKGDLPKDEWARIYGPQTSAFIEMYLMRIFADAILKRGGGMAIKKDGDDIKVNGTAALFEGVVAPAVEKDLDKFTKIIISFYKAVAPVPEKPPEGSVEDYLEKHSAGVDEEALEKVQKTYEELREVLSKYKKLIEDDNAATIKYNALAGEYLMDLKDKLGKKMPDNFPTARKDSIEDQEESGETLQEGMLRSITIDFAEIRRKQKHLDESFLVMFGSWVKWLLGKMFDGGSIPGTIKGSRSEVESFARAMGSEKRYIETAKRYGLDHPTTYKNKAKLSSATKSFEKETGIKWPFE